MSLEKKEISNDDKTSDILLTKVDEIRNELSIIQNNLNKEEVRMILLKIKKLLKKIL